MPLLLLSVVACLLAGHRIWRRCLVAPDLRHVDDIVMVEVRQIDSEANWLALPVEQERNIVRAMQDSIPWNVDSRFMGTTETVFLGVDLYALRITRTNGKRFEIAVGYPSFFIEGDPTAYVFPPEARNSILAILQQNKARGASCGLTARHLPEEKPKAGQRTRSSEKVNKSKH